MIDFAHIKKDYGDIQMLNLSPFVGFRDEVVSPKECQYLIDLASGKTQRAKVSLDKESDIIPGRSGDNCWLRYADDETVRAIGERLANIVGIPLENAEAMQIIHYGPNQEYRSHYDAYDLATERGQRCCIYGGQRLVTALVYLNDVELGGGTRFAKLNKEIQAKQGRLALFNNVGEDYSCPHPDSLHAGEAVKAGEKWAFNIWFHARPMKEKQDFQHYPNLAPSATTKSLSAPHPEENKTGLMTSKLNRANKVFQQSIDQLDPVLVRQASPVCFTYWDTYGNSQPDLSGLAAGTRVLKLVDRPVTNDLANKATLAQSLIDHNIASLAPTTYFNIHDAMNHRGEQTPIWFVKNIFGSGGKNMFCVTQADLAATQLKQDCIIQAGVTKLALFEGRKFTTRVYCLVWNHKVYLYQNGFLVVHGHKYDPESTDYGVQIDHTGYQKEDSQVQMVQFINYPEYERFYPQIRKLIQTLKPVLNPTRLAADSERYILLGIDVLLRQDGTARLLEINTVPNFIHSHEITNKVNVPFFVAALRTMLGDQSIVLEEVITNG